jgi:hypothetical protein
MTLMILILSVGEILVGSWSAIVPLWAEAIIRCAVVFSVAGFLYARKQTKVELSGRASF